MLSVYTVLEQPGVSTPETLGDAMLPASVLRGSEKPVHWGCGGISLLRVPGEGPLCSAIKHHLYVQICESVLFLIRIRRPVLYNVAPDSRMREWSLVSSSDFKWDALGLVLGIVSFL